MANSGSFWKLENSTAVKESHSQGLCLCLDSVCLEKVFADRQIVRTDDEKSLNVGAASNKSRLSLKQTITVRFCLTLIHIPQPQRMP